MGKNPERVVPILIITVAITITYLLSDDTAVYRKGALILKDLIKSAEFQKLISSKHRKAMNIFVLGTQQVKTTWVVTYFVIILSKY